MYFIKLLICLIAFLPIFTEASSTEVPKDWQKQPHVQSFITDMKQKHQLPEESLEKLFQQTEYKQSIIDAISRPAEKTKTWGEYRPIFIQEKNIQQGVEFWKKNATVLSRAEKNFGVPAEIITAIIGVETRYGQNKGKYRVIDALSTLAFFFPPREAFFKKELEAFLLLSKEQHWDALTIKGSYAGAMGFGQFMPSSHRKWAVDFNQDQTIDIINHEEDAIGSVANYFKAHGWQKGKPIFVRAQRKAPHEPITSQDPLNTSLKPNWTIRQLRTFGFLPIHPIQEDVLATPFSLEHTLGTDYILGLHNFFVVTEYNHSKLYAMAVTQLSEAIKARKNEQTKK